MKKKSPPGTISNQVEDYAVERDDLPLSLDRLDSPISSDINRRNQIHDWDEIRGKTPRHGAIAQFVHEQSKMGTSGRRPGKP